MLRHTDRLRRSKTGEPPSKRQFVSASAPAIPEPASNPAMILRGKRKDGGRKRRHRIKLLPLPAKA